MDMGRFVIKIGGAEVESNESLLRLAEGVRKLGTPPVIVHGGGKAIADALERMNIPFRLIDGVRATDAESIEVVEMVLSGLVNKRLVGALVEAGVRAVGLSGKDLGLLRAERLDLPGVDLGGYVGKITRVEAQVLEMFLERGIVPVISPISLGERGMTYNVNADHAALAVAQALGAAMLVFITDKPGVMIGDKLARQLTAEGAEELIAQGHIFGGMIPKVRSAIEALKGGVSRAYITDIDGLSEIEREEAGTIILAGEAGKRDESRSH